MNEERKANLVEMAIDNGSFPEELYKYRTADQAKLILNNYSFWFALPDSFNDPFDCNLSENESPTIEDLVLHLKRLGVSQNAIKKSEESFANSPQVIFDLVTNAKDNSIKKKGVLSLSRIYDDILMWSHYADYHKGVVFGLELRKDLDFFVMPINVNYQEKYTALDYLKDPQKSTIDTLKIKSSQWSYEKEVRIYKNKSQLYSINSSALSSIYFGVNTAKEEIDEIKSICKEKGLNNISFHQAKKAHGEFKLIFNKI